MKRALAALALLVGLGGAAAPEAPKPGPPKLELRRLDCGQIWVPRLNDYSDTEAYGGLGRRFAVSCYLIRHGDAWMLWDTGLPKSELGKTLSEGAEESTALKTSIVDQLAALKLAPADIAIVGISHRHFDHIGQASDFPQARLLLGRADFERVKARGGEGAAALDSWTKGAGKAEPVDGDLDVFGDGSVVMLALPGHTAGHHGLVVRLASGPVLLSGDVVHFRENLLNEGAPPFNESRADSLASIGRVQGLARNIGAKLVIGHDERDIPLLPAFPDAAG